MLDVGNILQTAQSTLDADSRYLWTEFINEFRPKDILDTDTIQWISQLQSRVNYPHILQSEWLGGEGRNTWSFSDDGRIIQNGVRKGKSAFMQLFVDNGEKLIILSGRWRLDFELTTSEMLVWEDPLENEPFIVWMRSCQAWPAPASTLPTRGVFSRRTSSSKMPMSKKDKIRNKSGRRACKCFG